MNRIEIRWDHPKIILSYYCCFSSSSSSYIILCHISYIVCHMSYVMDKHISTCIIQDYGKSYIVLSLHIPSYTYIYIRICMIHTCVDVITYFHLHSTYIMFTYHHSQFLHVLTSLPWSKNVLSTCDCTPHPPPPKQKTSPRKSWWGSVLPERQARFIQ